MAQGDKFNINQCLKNDLEEKKKGKRFPIRQQYEV